LFRATCRIRKTKTNFTATSPADFTGVVCLSVPQQVLCALAYAQADSIIIDAIADVTIVVIPTDTAAAGLATAPAVVTTKA